MKKAKDVLKQVIPKHQQLLIEKAIVETNELTQSLFASTLQIGKEKMLLIYGEDINNNTHFAMLSEETFTKLKKIKL